MQAILRVIWLVLMCTAISCVNIAPETGPCHLGLGQIFSYFRLSLVYYGFKSRETGFPSGLITL